MTFKVYGWGAFKYTLSDEELEAIKKHFRGTDQYPSVFLTNNDVEFDDSWESDLSDLTALLEKYHNGFKEGTTFSYYGDYDGGYRWEDGHWETYEAMPLCNVNDEALIEEMKYRGYTVSKKEV